MEALPVDHSPRQDGRAAQDATGGPLGLFDLILSEGPEAPLAGAETGGRHDPAERRDPAEAPGKGRPLPSAERAPGDDPVPPPPDPAGQTARQPAPAPAAEAGTAPALGRAGGPEAQRPLAAAPLAPATTAGPGTEQSGPPGGPAASQATGRPEAARGGDLRPAIAAAASQAEAKAPAGAANDPSRLAEADRRAGPDLPGQAALAVKVAQASAASAAGGAGSKAASSGLKGASGTAATGGQARTAAATAEATGAALTAPAAAALSKDTLLSLAVDPVAAAPGDPLGVDPGGAGGLRPSLAATPAAAAPGDFAGLLRGAAAEARGGANEQVAVQIRRAVAAGNDRISIRLHPAELGRVQVRLEIAEDGHVRALITAERAETLDLMQRDLRGLERALQDAGLKTESGSLSFSLQDQQGEPFQAAEEQSRERPGAAGRQADADELEQSLTLTWSAGDGRLDIRI
ncbi:MAG: flagellar hook-length control protein FliK [Kiloniellales bacterium]|nr:flagellar hook-length control protein FliK [Kiloniellales bacterium]